MSKHIICCPYTGVEIDLEKQEPIPDTLVYLCVDSVACDEYHVNTGTDGYVCPELEAVEEAELHEAFSSALGGSKKLDWIQADHALEDYRAPEPHELPDDEEGPRPRFVKFEPPKFEVDSAFAVFARDRKAFVAEWLKGRSAD